MKINIIKAIEKFTKNQQALQEILNQHKLWLETNGAKGRRANLRYADLRYADPDFLSAATLRDTDLSNATLSNADLCVRDPIMPPD